MIQWFKKIDNTLNKPAEVTVGFIMGIYLGFAGIWLALASITYKLH